MYVRIFLGILFCKNLDIKSGIYIGGKDMTNSYTVVETTNMAAVKYAARIYDVVCEENIENGTFGYLDGLAGNDGDVIYKFVKGFKAGETPIMAKNPEWSEETYNTGHTKDMRRDNYINEAGVPFRGFEIKKHDEFAITLPGITEDTQSIVSGTEDFTETDVFLTIDATTGKLKAATISTSGAEFEARIMRKRMLGGTLSTPIRNYGYSYMIYEVRVTTTQH